MMGDITPRIKNLAQRMLFVNDGKIVLVGRLAAAILLRYETALKTGKGYPDRRGSTDDITHAEEIPLKEDIWRIQKC